MNRTRAFSADDLLITSAIFVTVFMSGGIHVISPFILAAVDSILLLALYIRNRTYIHRTMYEPVLILSVLFVYVAILSRNYEDIVYIFFRGTQFGLAFLLVNYFITKGINWISVLNSVLLLFLAHGILNCIFINIFGSAFTQISLLGKDINAFLIFIHGTSSTPLPLLGFAVQRNQGLFWEPGVFQIYMNILFFINVFIRKNYRIAVLALIMVVSTFSTVGYIILLIQVFTFLRYDYKLASLRRELLMLAIVPLLLGLCVYSYFIIQDKFLGASRGSFDARVRDTRTGLAVLLEKPWGIGFSTKKYMRMYNDANITEYTDYDPGNLNSIMKLFHSTGIVWGMLFLYYIYKQGIFLTKRPVVFVMLMLSLSSEPLFYSPFFLLFPISAMAQKRIQDIARAG